MVKRQATLEDVAALAGVSQQTVSRVLNNPGIVSARTQEKVLDAMARLSYVPNRSAQLLAGKALPTLGLITTSLNLHAPSQIAAAVKIHAAARGYQVVISMAETLELPAIRAILDEFRAQNLDRAIISLPLEKEDAERLAAGHPEMQCLFLDVPPDAGVHHLGFDHRDGSRSSIEHLWALGHRRFALLAGPMGSVSARLRLGSWQETLAGLGAEDAPTAHGDWSASSGWTQAMALLRQAPDITAMLVANDQMALGALHALHQSGRRVPQDLSVIGYDDTPDSQFFLPALTTVAQDFDLLGERAVQHALALDPSQAHFIDELLPTALVLRQSTAARRTLDARERRIEQVKAWVAAL